MECGYFVNKLSTLSDPTEEVLCREEEGTPVLHQFLFSNDLGLDIGGDYFDTGSKCWTPRGIWLRQVCYKTGSVDLDGVVVGVVSRIDAGLLVVLGLRERVGITG